MNVAERGVRLAGSRVLRSTGPALALAVASGACGSGTQGTGRVADASFSGTEAGPSRDDARTQATDAPRDTTAAPPDVDAGPSAPMDGSRDAARPTDGAQEDGGCGGGCPAGYTCGTANGLPVCRAASGVPLFKHVFVIMEENTSLSTLDASINANAAPNFASIRATYAGGTNYHGVAHPSLPNYIALTSGSTQGISCDCHAQSGQGTCSALDCNLVLGDCTCSQSAKNLADQIEAVNRTWMAFGESMGSPCNVVDGTNYAVRHVPFLYYDDIQSNASRCNSHVVDYSNLDLGSAPDFTYIAPNLIDDMHNPLPATQENITDGDTWIGPVVANITTSQAYKDGGLLVIVWDEDDDSGGITGTDDPIPIFVLSPYAKRGGYSSPGTMNHYSLLATIEDGLDLPRMGMAAVADPQIAATLADYFPKD